MGTKPAFPATFLGHRTRNAAVDRTTHGVFFALLLSVLCYKDGYRALNQLRVRVGILLAFSGMADVPDLDLIFDP